MKAEFNHSSHGVNGVSGINVPGHTIGFIVVTSERMDMYRVLVSHSVRLIGIRLHNTCCKYLPI